MNKISLEWVENLVNSPTEKEEFLVYLSNNQRLINRLLEILLKKELSISNIETSLSTYSDSSYPYKQAHINGRKALIQELKQLLTIV